MRARAATHADRRVEAGGAEALAWRLISREHPAVRQGARGEEVAEETVEEAEEETEEEEAEQAAGDDEEEASPPPPWALRRPFASVLGLISGGFLRLLSGGCCRGGRYTSGISRVSLERSRGRRANGAAALRRASLLEQAAA